MRVCIKTTEHVPFTFYCYLQEVVKLNSHFYPPEESVSTTTASSKAHNNGSILEHKLHVTKVVNERHCSKKPQAILSNSFLDINLGKQTFCQPVLSNAGPAELANPALHEHTHFTAEPHPLVVTKNGRHKAVKGRQSNEVNLKEKENSAEFIKKASHVKGLAPVNAKDWDDYLDEDPEYYTELENMGGNRKKQQPTSVRKVITLK